MDPGLLIRMSAAGLSGDPDRLQAAVDEFHDALASGDPEAVAMYQQHQGEALGVDPLAVGACEWPAQLADPGTVIDVPASAPLLGWRMWAVRGSHLVAPFLTDKWGLDRKAPGVEWRPGVNKVNTSHCGRARPARKGQRPTTHPLPSCRCGIRAVQSLTVLDAFADSTREHLGSAPGATAQVEVWGRVAGYAPDDDWQYTLRAQYARIVGPLELAYGHAEQRTGLARRYGLDVTL